MKIKILSNIIELRNYFGLVRDGVILENDLDVVENDCDHFERKRRDAEVLCTLGANSPGDCLDLGTSRGRSAFKLATNLAGRGRVFTVNLLPEQYDATAGRLVTHLLPKEEIGSFFRERGVENIEQIYADTARWVIPETITNLGMAFVDAAHDTERVYADSKKVYEHVRPGGFLCWHDFSPEHRAKYHWIDAAMRGVEQFMASIQ